MSEDDFFETTDPLGRIVRLKNDNWVEHVSLHSETTSDDIIRNIQSPRYICINVKPEFDGSDVLIVDNSRNDYIDIIPVSGKMYVLKTIVQFDNYNFGVVVTNYVLGRANEIKTSGGIIYDSRQSKNTK